MPKYHLRLFSSRGRLVRGRFVQCDDDEQARVSAERMLAGQGITQVEVWRAEKLLCAVGGEHGRSKARRLKAN
jgi:glucokinase